MGRKKKRAAPNARDRIFCYYCDRTFQQEQELLAHQKEKHLRCPYCTKRMLSVQSMLVHAEQMHNCRVSIVPNSIPGRESVAVDVLGMTGIPDSFYASLDDAHHPKRPRDSHLSPIAVPHIAPTAAYVDARPAYMSSSAPSAPPYAPSHAYPYGAQPATHAASSYQYQQQPAAYSYSAPSRNASAPNYQYAYNAAHAAYSSAPAPPVYAPSADAAPYASYAQPPSYSYAPPTRLPPLRAAYAAATPADALRSQQPTPSSHAVRYSPAEAARSPTAPYNNHYAPQQLYAPQPADAVADAAGNAAQTEQGKLIFELRHCSPEEQRAQLPRYVTKPRCATTS